MIDSTASDSDVPPDVMRDLLADDDSGESPVTSPPTPSRQRQSLATPTATAKTLLIAFLVISFFFALVSLVIEYLHPLRETLWIGAILFGIQVTLIWPFYSACDDLRTIRERTPRQ